MKTCSKCGENKLINDFNRDSSNKCGFRSYCRDCSKRYGQSTYSKNRDKFQHDKLKSRYGISINQYNELLNNQNNVCAICKKPEITKSKVGKIQKLSVDHDHKTGKVRALLCSNCNRGIGYLQDDFDLILQAAKYIQQHKGSI